VAAVEALMVVVFTAAEEAVFVPLVAGALALVAVHRGPVSAERVIAEPGLA
jgi:hypothetical protein